MRANIRIVREYPEVLVIRDVVPWDRFKTVTNDAEGVIEHLWRNRILNPNQRLLCYDSNGDLDELIVGNWVFVRFSPIQSYTLHPVYKFKAYHRDINPHRTRKHMASENSYLIFVQKTKRIFILMVLV